MHKLRSISNVNISPWEIPLQERIQELNQYISQGYKIALYMYEKADTSTFRYRVYNVYQTLKESKEWRVVYFFQNEIHLLPGYIDKIELISIIRMRWTFQLDEFISRVKLRGLPILFDVDDLVFDLEYLPLLTNTLNVNFSDERDYEYWFAYISRIQYTASKADGFITTNAFLGEQLKKKFGKEYGIIKNYLNKEQTFVSKKYFENKKKKRGERPFTIGYFSGTPSHINDFKAVSREIVELLNQYEDIQLKVVGFMEFDADLQPLIKQGRICFHPLVDFVELQKLIAEVDVNIIPLVRNTFTNCKSELKFFEAAVVGTISCATPTYVYKSIIEDGVNGFLCSQGQWYRTIERIYLGQVDEINIVNKAKEYAYKHYTGKNILDEIECTLDKFTKLN